MGQVALAIGSAEISAARALELYRLLVHTRMLEEEIHYICSNQTPHNPFIVGKGYLSTGQEAVAAGSVVALEADDWYAQSHRDLAAHLHRGVTTLEVFEQYRCTGNSPTQGKDGNMHFAKAGTQMVGFTSHMGQNVGVAVGLAWAQVYNKTNRVALATFGEGAAQQGIIHECMNYAAVFKLPLIFVVNNNGWAISVPVSEQMIIEDVAQRGAAYGMPSVVVDGNDAVAVYQATSAAVARARAGEGPALIECKTFRIMGHGTHDPATYVPKAEKEAWSKRDPIDHMRSYLVERKWWDESKEQQLRATIKEAIDAAVDVAGNDAPPDPSMAGQGVYSQPYPVE